MLVDKFDEHEQSLSTKTSKMVAQITPEGKNYTDLHTSWVKKVKWEIVFSIIATLISIATLLVDIYAK